MCLFLKGGQVYPVPPSMASRRPFFCRLPALPLVVGGGGNMQVSEVLGGVGWLCDPWRDYLNRFSPATSSHWGRCTLIRCASTRDPRMQRWVARTKVIAILLLMYPHVFE